MVKQMIQNLKIWFLSTIDNLKQKGLFDLLVVNLLTQFVSFGSLLLVAKFLTIEEYGNIKIIQSYAAFFIILAGFGFNTSLLKLAAENRTDREKEGILQLILKRVTISSLITVLILAILSLSGAITSSSHLALWLIIYSISIPFQSITGIFIVYLQAQKKIKAMARVQAVIKIQSVIIIVICTLIWGFKGFIFSSILAFVLGLFPLLRLTGISFLKISSIVKPSGMDQYAFYSLLANGLSQLWLISDVYILDHFSANRISIGYYALALIFITAASQVTGTIQAIATPYFSEHSADMTWLKSKLMLNQTRLAILSIIVALGVYIVAWFLIPLVYGSDYLETLIYLRILLVRYVIWSSCALIGTALVGLGLMKYNFIIQLIVTPLAFLLSYSLLQNLGVPGVAWGQVITSVILLILALVAIKIAFRNISNASEVR
jgi:O-antigen/teichoic acid export membrane protein